MADCALDWNHLAWQLLRYDQVVVELLGLDFPLRFPVWQHLPTELSEGIPGILKLAWVSDEQAHVQLLDALRLVEAILVLVDVLDQLQIAIALVKGDLAYGVVLSAAVVVLGLVQDDVVCA